MPGTRSSPLLITHLATTLAGGAGVALHRTQVSLLKTGLHSRVLAGQPPIPATVGRGQICPATLPGLPERLLRRAGVQIDGSRRMLDALGKARPPSARPEDLELFSPPFSRHRPELHPWVTTSEILHLHWIAGFVDWPRFFRSVHKPVVFTLHDQQNYLGGVHYENDLTANPWLAHLEQRARQIKHEALSGHLVSVIGNSEWNTRIARASGFFPAGTMFHTIPYALDTQLYSPRIKAEAKASLGLPPQRLVVGFASDDLGNRRKGFDILVQALGSLSAAAPDVSLLSFGRSPDISLANSLALPWSHLGFIDADAVKAAAYSAMDVFIVPSRAEAFGQTAIEAMACGTPVIASHVGGLPEALDFGRCGLLVEADRPDLLNEAIQLLLKSPERRAALAEDARRHVVARHDPLRHASACEQIYHELLNRTAGDQTTPPF